MRLSIVPPALAAAFVLAPAAFGHTPAWSQDFSITNPEKPAPVDAGQRDLMRELQAWWDVHAYYPRHASQNDEGGTVGVHLEILRDGRVRSVRVARGSGSPSLDAAALRTFTGGFVRAFPEGAADTEVDISLHYVLEHRHDQPVPADYRPVPSRSAFTITNEPVKPPILEKMLQKTCTGTIVSNGVINHPLYGMRYYDSTLVFFRTPDAKPWVKISEGGQMAIAPVVEVGKLVSWRGPTSSIGFTKATQTLFYTAWLDGSNKLKGTVSTDIGGNPNFGGGTIDFTCSEAVAPPVEWNSWYVQLVDTPVGDPP